MPQRVHRRDVRRFGAGVAVLIVIGLTAGTGIRMQMGEGMPGKPYTYITAEFHDVGWLSPRAQVVENGVRIGQVDSITQRGGQVSVVRMRLEGNKNVYRDATATVSNASALGRRRILLDLGHPQAGALGNRTIQTPATKDSRSFDDIYAGLDRRTRQSLASSLRELGGGSAGHSDDLQSFVRTSARSLNSVGEISTALVSPKTDLASLLASANRLTARFAMRHAELTRLLRQTDETFRAINVDEGQPLDGALKALPASLRQARQGLDSLNAPLADLRTTMATLQPGGHALGQTSHDLRGVLREAVVPLNKVPGVSNGAAPALEDLTHTVANARPLVPRLAGALDAAALLLHDLAPYAPDLGRWASEHDVLSGRVRPGQHYLSLTPILPGTYMFDLPDPMVERNPYPEPGGEAWEDDATRAGAGGGR